MKKRWYESHPGRISVMRIMAVTGFFVAVAIAAGTSITIWHAGKGDLSLVSAWLLFAGGCITGKNFQKKREINEVQ